MDIAPFIFKLALNLLISFAFRTSYHRGWRPPYIWNEKQCESRGRSEQSGEYKIP